MAPRVKSTTSLLSERWSGSCFGSRSSWGSFAAGEARAYAGRLHQIWRKLATQDPPGVLQWPVGACLGRSEWAEGVEVVVRFLPLATQLRQREEAVSLASHGKVKVGLGSSRWRSS